MFLFCGCLRFFFGYIFCVLFLQTRLKYRFNKHLGIVAHVIILLVGYAATHYYYHFNHPNYLSQGGNTKVLFQVTQQPDYGGKFYKTYVKAIQQNGKKVQGRALIYLEIGEQAPQYGDQILTELALHPI